MEKLLLILPAIVLLAYLISAIANMFGKIETFLDKLIPFVAMMAVVAVMCLQIPGFKGLVHDMLHWVSNHTPDLTAVAHAAQKAR